MGDSGIYIVHVYEILAFKVYLSLLRHITSNERLETHKSCMICMSCYTHLELYAYGTLGYLHFYCRRI